MVNKTWGCWSPYLEKDGTFEWKSEFLFGDTVDGSNPAPVNA